MNLEPVTQNEVSQNEKNRYHILMHIYGIQKNGIDEPFCREGMKMEDGLVDTVGEGESGMNGERSTNKYAIV